MPSLVNALKEKKELMLAAFVEDLSIIDFNAENRKIIIAELPKSSFYSQKDIQANLLKTTGKAWVIEVIENSEKEGKSINQEKIEELEKRKKDAINSPTIQRLMTEFEGAQIVKVE